MSEFLEEFRTTAVTVQSESRAVAVTQASFSCPTVEIDTRKLLGHDEYTLAEEIEKTIMAAHASHLDKLREIADRHDRCGEVSPDNVIARHLPELAADIEVLEGLGTSACGYVKAAAYGDGDVAVQFLHNAIRRTDINNAALETGVNEAITQAKEELVSQIRQLYRQRIADARRNAR